MNTIPVTVEKLESIEEGEYMIFKNGIAYDVIGVDDFNNISTIGSDDLENPVSYFRRISYGGGEFRMTELKNIKL
jgi:hypothetical protein